MSRYRISTSLGVVVFDGERAMLGRVDVTERLDVASLRREHDALCRVGVVTLDEEREIAAAESARRRRRRAA